LTDPRFAERFPWALVVVFVGFAVGIAAAGYHSFEETGAHIVEEKKHELGAIADLKVGQIVDWWRTREAQARFLRENPLLAEAIEGFFRDPGDETRAGRIRSWFGVLRRNFGYESVLLFDARATSRLAGEGGESSAPQVRTGVRECLRRNDIIFTDLHRDESAGTIHLALFVPISASGRTGPPIGAVYLRLDPEAFLYPLVKSWPTPSSTAETLLVRRDGEDVVFVSDPRHRRGSALSLRFPLAQANLPAALAARGIETVNEGVDYRGVRVLAASRIVRGTPWFMVAKIDLAELDAPIRSRALLIAGVGGALVLLAAAAIGLVWRQRRVRYYRRGLALERQRAAEREADARALRRSNEELRQFAHIASHDLQEPLRMIASFLQLIERRCGDRLDKDGREFVAYAVGGAQRLQSMIEGLLQYSRVEHHEDAFSNVESGMILDRALANLEPLLQESGAVVTHADLPRVVGDEALLEQLFQHLLSNAVQYRGAAPPRIHVSCERRPEGWRFAVRDNGMGIEEHHRERIFQIFQRLCPQTYPGVGIGLAVCRRIVERHGGRVWVESTPGEGSTFFFTIPWDRGKELGHD
jgi:signal transduction histidine kinase